MQAQSSKTLEGTKQSATGDVTKKEYEEVRCQLERRKQELDAIKEHFTAELKNRTLAMDQSKMELIVATEQFCDLEKQYASSQTMLSTKTSELEAMEASFKKQVTDMHQKSAQLSSQMQMQQKESAQTVKALTVQVADLRNEQSGAIKKMQEVEQFNSTLKKQLSEAQVLRYATSLWHTAPVGIFAFVHEVLIHCALFAVRKKVVGRLEEITREPCSSCRKQMDNRVEGRSGPYQLHASAIRRDAEFPCHQPTRRRKAEATAERGAGASSEPQRRSRWE